ncbi:MAG: hypothetical protein HY700_03745 [Gemmatimonadetes bacterium]|nr:hypothetical protein [Gemmatimonadota bacterium]
MSVTDPAARLSAGLSDRYQIERELGEGGMATVYLAHDLRHDRRVALKVLRPDLASILGAERFLGEIGRLGGSSPLRPPPARRSRALATYGQSVSRLTSSRKRGNGPDVDRKL